MKSCTNVAKIFECIAMTPIYHVQAKSSISGFPEVVKSFVEANNFEGLNQYLSGFADQANEIEVVQLGESVA